MNSHRILPEKITQPIQLLAAWLVGLLIIDTAFLVGASRIQMPAWAPAALVIASILNVPLFLCFIFFLQTRYRPEMQEDEYYSQYLERTTRFESVESVTDEVTAKVIERVGPAAEEAREPIRETIRESQLEQMARQMGDYRTISELYLSPETWSSIAYKWYTSHVFQEELRELQIAGLIDNDTTDYRGFRLTETGREVAEIAQQKGLLWKQSHEFKWQQEHDEAILLEAPIPF
jgi:hypothetical protein